MDKLTINQMAYAELYPYQDDIRLHDIPWCIYRLSEVKEDTPMTDIIMMAKKHYELDKEDIEQGRILTIGDL